MLHLDSWFRRGLPLSTLLFLVCLSGFGAVGWSQEMMVSPGAVWKYLDDGSSPPPGWVGLGFDDSGWSSGAAELGYGDGDEATVVGFGGNAAAKFITTYFRRTFTLVDASVYTNLMVGLVRDDGAVVHLNGVEVFRSNMPAGVVTSSTRASASVGGAGETTFFAMGLSAASLVNGVNVLAVEIHQQAPDSSDLSFDLELLGNIPNDPPVVSISSPANNSALGRTVATPITVSASDTDGMVVSVTVRAGASVIGTDTQAPYSVSWMPPGVGNFALTATALDSSGVTATSAVVNVTVVENLPPVVSLVAPANGTRIGHGLDLELTAGAADADGTVQSVEFFMDGMLLGVVTGTTRTLLATNLAVGVRAFTAVAHDDDGLATTSGVVNVTVEAGLFVGFGASWKYLDDGSDQGTGWIAPGFNDSGWASGEGQLGYGDGDEATVVSFGGVSSDKHVTTYFRHRFVVADAASVTNLELMVILDDGAVVYLNGVELFRDNMPATHHFETFTLAGAADEDEPIRVVLGAGSLVEGVNLLAVEVHQQSRTSSDLSFDLSLRGNIGNAAPVVAITLPLAGAMLSVGSNVVVSAEASDTDGTVVRVAFFLDGLLVGEAGAAPYSLVLSNLVGGDRELTAVAYDNGGAMGLAAPVRFQLVGNLPPSVMVLEPPDGAERRAGDGVQVRAAATDLDGVVRRVEFYDGVVKLGEVESAPYDFLWMNVPPGLRELVVVATDDMMGRATSVVTLNMVLNRTPEVSIASPANGAVLAGGTLLEIEIDAMDHDGVVERVELYMGPVKVAERLEPPWRVALPGLGPGFHAFHARAFDNEGAFATSDSVSLELSLHRTLVPQGSIWRYLDTGVDQGVGWRQPGFDDSGWAEGAAEFGYGDDDEVTVVSFGGDETNKFPTTYYRHSFVLNDVGAFTSLRLGLLRDDGGVVYLNGVEVFRDNMPAGAVLYATFATAAVASETDFVPGLIDPSVLVEGVNVLAVEIHQSSLTSSDSSFDLRLTGADEVFVSRGPYLQNTTPHGVTVRWRTAGLSDTRLFYGTDPDLLDREVSGGGVQTNEHLVVLGGLDPETTYYYAVGGPSGILAASPGFFFTTFPESGSSADTRIWVLGDSGKGGASARAVRDAFYDYNGTAPLDLVLMLGDNAYENGTDLEFQERLFEMFSTTLQRTPLYPVIGNHDTANSTDPPPTIPYFESFSLPQAGEAGGVPSGTEKYYSFDYGNIHFVCLDTQSSDRSLNGPMLTWLRADLELNNKHWLFVTAGNPPYGAIGNDSDVKVQNRDVRENILPILEAHGLDLFIAGDDHAYERSFLLNGHYGLSNSLASTMILNGGSGDPGEGGPYNKLVLGPLPHRGAVYVVSGASSQLDAGTNTHPAMFISRQILGSLILDVSETAVDVRYLTATGVVEDYFRIIKPKHHNFPPLAEGGARSTFEDRPLPIVVSGSDWNGDPIRFRLVRLPEFGELRVGGEEGEPWAVGTLLSPAEAAGLVYVPGTNANGIVSFEFVANDGLRDSLPALFQIRVFAFNDPPVAAAGADQQIECAGPLTRVSLDGGQSMEFDGEPLTYTWHKEGAIVGTAATVDLDLPAGPHLLELTVEDPRRTRGSDQVMVIISDTTAPVVSCAGGMVQEYVDGAGARVSYAAPTAVDLCDGVLSPVCNPPSGGIFPIGITGVICGVVDGSGNAGECGFTVEVTGPWAVHQNVFRELVEAWLAAGRAEDRSHLADAIARIVQALEAGMWVDQVHLGPAVGQKVFEADGRVVEELQDILQDAGTGVAQGAVRGMIDRLVAADRLVALMAIDEAEGAGTSPAKVAEDRAELLKGDQDRDAGHYRKAVEHYGRAWSRSVRLKIRLEENMLRLEFSGGSGGGYRIETSTNLVDWEPAGQPLDGGEGARFLDLPLGGAGSRFYRVVEP